MELVPLALRGGITLTTIEGLPDRRQLALQTDAEEAPSPPPPPSPWLFQAELEGMLYGAGPSTGAYYRLLRRAGCGEEVLSLRAASVATGLVTQREYRTLLAHAASPSARAVALVPVAVAARAAITFGKTPSTVALLKALKEPLPEEWQEGDSDDEDELGDGGDGSGDGAGGDAGVNDDDADSGNGSDVATTDEDHEPVVVGGSGGGDSASVSVTAGAASTSTPAVTGSKKKRKRSATPRAAKAVVSAAPPLPLRVATELASFKAYRLEAINRYRRCGKVEAKTVENDCQRGTAFLQWIHRTKDVAQPTVCGVFGSPQIATVVQQRIEELVALKRTYATAAQYTASYLQLTRWVEAVRQMNGRETDGSSVAKLEALHIQCKQQARQEAKFARKPGNWLDWADVQRARQRAEAALKTAVAEAKAASMPPSAEAKAELLQLTQAVCIVKLLTHQPPDRVGVTRTLQLGGSLKHTPDGGGFVVDLSAPNAHKTSSLFGPTKSSVPQAVVPVLATFIQRAGLRDGCYLFHAVGDASKPLAAPAWTKLVKAIFERFANVPLAPKDLRSSFVTFLKSEEHSDETLRSAALAMKHSSQMADSVAYDMGKHDRLVAASMRVAAEYAARFA